MTTYILHTIPIFSSSILHSTISADVPDGLKKCSSSEMVYFLITLVPWVSGCDQQRCRELHFPLREAVRQRLEDHHRHRPQRHGLRHPGAGQEAHQGRERLASILCLVKHWGTLCFLKCRILLWWSGILFTWRLVSEKSESIMKGSWEILKRVNIRFWNQKASVSQSWSSVYPCPACFKFKSFICQMHRTTQG